MITHNVLVLQELPPKARTFLDAIGRNSTSSEHVYKIGLLHFQQFLNGNVRHLDLGSIIEPLQTQQINVYELLDRFVSYLMQANLATPSISLYIAALRSYFAYYDIDVVSNKFKRKVKMPKHFREDEEPLDVADIRNLLLKCNNRKLKAYVLVLASSGLRAMEACALRLKDIDLTVSPTKIHVRKEFSKTKASRIVYISDEATTYLKDLINWKYRSKSSDPEHLVFSVYFSTKNGAPQSIYSRIVPEFQRLLAVTGMDDRKEDGKGIRRRITLHSMRRFCKGVISDQAGQDYSEWFLGHSKSVYWTRKELERRQIYKTRCMNYLTFLDYYTLETTGKNIEAMLSEKEQEIKHLRQRDAMNRDAISALSDQLSHVMEEIELLKQVRT
jgi:integrase